MSKGNSYLVRFLLLMLIYPFSNTTFGQIRIESFFGNDEPVIDVFWIKPVQEHSSLLYLNRNKFGLPKYESESPRFSTLHVLSYQLEKTGWGVAIAGTANNADFQGRVGIQFLKVKPNHWLFYTIASTKIGTNGDFRQLIIAQFTPKLSKKWRWFNRLEWVSAFGYDDSHRFSQGILKEGFQVNFWQFGLGAELLWVGNSFSSFQKNWGFFVARIF